MSEFWKGMLRNSDLFGMSPFTVFMFEVVDLWVEIGFTSNVFDFVTDTEPN